MKLHHELNVRIKHYMDQVSAHLTGLSPDERADILSSIETHIHDALSRRAEGEPTLQDLEVVMAEMDHPDTYAAVSPGSSSNPAKQKPTRGKFTYAVVITIILFAGILTQRVLTAGNPSILLRLRHSITQFSTPKMYPRNMVADLYHGSLPAEIISVMEREGFTIQKSDVPLSADTLKFASVLWVSDVSRRAYRPAELKAIQSFVMSGGTLLCSDQAWYWSYSKPVMDHPVNQIGERFGFTVTSHNIGTPTIMEASEYFSGVKLTKQTEWWPSKIDVAQNKFAPLIRDENMNIMAVHFPYGNGQVFVFGHGELLRNNPDVVLNIMRRM